jgi:hypothetical protein
LSGRTGTTVKASDWLHCPFDNPMLPPKKAVRKGQQGKAVGCVPPTALLFELAMGSIQDQRNQTLNQHDGGHARDGKY